MKKLNYLFYIILLLFFYACTPKNKTEFYLPAEWEPQSGVIVGGLDDNASFEMVNQLAREMKVFCLASDSTVATYKTKLSAVGVNLDSIQFLTSSTEFSYAQRDGVIFLKNGMGEKKLVDFAWNMYGWYFDSTIKDYIDKDKEKRALYTSVHLKAFPYPVITSSMVNEGGAIETNGKGVILQVESVNMHRNPTMSKELQEAELKKVLNAKKDNMVKRGCGRRPVWMGNVNNRKLFWHWSKGALG